MRSHNNPEIVQGKKVTTGKRRKHQKLRHIADRFFSNTFTGRLKLSSRLVAERRANSSPPEASASAFVPPHTSPGHDAQYITEVDMSMLSAPLAWRTSRRSSFDSMSSGASYVSAPAQLDSLGPFLPENLSISTMLSGSLLTPSPSSNNPNHLYSPSSAGSSPMLDGSEYPDNFGQNQSQDWDGVSFQSPLDGHQPPPHPGYSNFTGEIPGAGFEISPSFLGVSLNGNFGQSSVHSQDAITFLNPQCHDPFAPYTGSAKFYNRNTSTEFNPQVDSEPRSLNTSNDIYTYIPTPQLDVEGFPNPHITIIPPNSENSQYPWVGWDWTGNLG